MSKNNFFQINENLWQLLLHIGEKGIAEEKNDPVEIKKEGEIIRHYAKLVTKKDILNARNGPPIMNPDLYNIFLNLAEREILISNHIKNAEEGTSPSINNKINQDIKDQFFNAMRENDLEKITTLLKENPALIKEDKDDYTAFDRAYYRGHINLVKLLHSFGADIQGKNNTTTPLHLAIKKGHKEIVKYLIKEDVNLHFKDKSGYEPLKLCNKLGNQEIFNLIYEALEKEHDQLIKKNNKITLENEHLLDLMKKFYAVFSPLQTEQNDEVDISGESNENED